MRSLHVAQERSFAVQEFTRKLNEGTLDGDLMLELNKLSGPELEELAQILTDRQS